MNHFGKVFIFSCQTIYGFSILGYLWYIFLTFHAEPLMIMVFMGIYVTFMAFSRNFAIFPPFPGLFNLFHIIHILFHVICKCLCIISAYFG